jgi:pyruvate formate lyase activating enzyme
MHYNESNGIIMQTGEIFDIKKYAIHDGPGIRTTVFFKGCPLSCWWCHNPESLSTATQRLYRQERCIGCQECLAACSNGAIRQFENHIQWTAADCRYCQTCAQVCPAEAVEFIGKTMTVTEVVNAITKDTLFYDQSGGGVTISGGEPLMQPSFLMQLLDACGKLEIHRTLDTSGHVETRTLLKAATRTDLFLYDLKHMDPEKHYRYTGVSNDTILTNLKQLSRQGAVIIIRLPVIPGINADEKNIDRTGSFLASLAGVIGINLLPYHCAAKAKYRNFGLQNKAADFARPAAEVITTIARHLESYNLEVKIGG